MMVGLAFLMVSTISYPSIKQLKLERRKLFDVLPLLLLLIALLIILKEYLEHVVFAGFMIYVVGGIVGHLTRRWWHPEANRQSAHGGSFDTATDDELDEEDEMEDDSQDDSTEPHSHDFSGGTR